MRTRLSLAALCLALSGVCFSAATPAAADAHVFHAVSSGQRALDGKDGGGNPFATALIESLASGHVRLGELPQDLKTLTAALSNNKMMADVPRKPEPAGWNVVPAAAGEVRKALVLITSDYSRSGGAPSLPGARRDAGRIEAALRSAGFDTEVALDLDAAGMREKLEAFGEASRSADAAVIYTTGHGVEVDGRVYVIPGDFPVKEKNAALPAHAVPLTAIASSLHARAVNLVFYGGCRDNPFGN